MRYLSDSPERTMEIGKEYAKSLKDGDVVLLYGDLGAGKTAFTKGVALGLGIRANVTSPTYAYMNDYGGVLYHYDCYRLSSGEDAEGLGLTDYFYSDGVCLIEWPDNIADVLPAVCKRVYINKTGLTDREIITDEPEL